MSLERLVEEIRARANVDVGAAVERQKTEIDRIATERDRALEALGAETERATAAEIGRERAQRIAAARLTARQLLYEARSERMNEALEETRRILSDYTSDPAYPRVLSRMVDLAHETLGPKLKFTGRAEDASRLKNVAGSEFDPAPAPIVGGLLASTADGSRRLNLSFDELLRLRGDRVRELLA